jgi:hypothetical protein
MRKPRTINPASKREKYLRRNFLISEKEYNDALRKNGGVCSITGNPPGTVSLHVDHDHKIERWKIVSEKGQGVWYSWPKGYGRQDSGIGRLKFVEFDRLKAVSRAKVKARLKRLSVRGILSWLANSGLRKWQDNPEYLKNAAKYIRNYQKFLAGESNYRNGFEGE